MVMEQELGGDGWGQQADCAREKGPVEQKGSRRGEVGAKSWQVTCGWLHGASRV